MIDTKTEHQKPKVIGFGRLASVMFWMAVGLAILYFKLPENYYWPIFLISMLYLLIGFHVTSPGYAYSLIGLNGIASDVMVVPLVTFLFYPFERVSKKYYGFIGIRPVKFNIDIYSKMATKRVAYTEKDKDGNEITKHRKEKTGTLSMNVKGFLNVRTVNLSKVVLNEGNIEGINTQIRESMEDPIRSIGRTNTWDKIVFALVKGDGQTATQTIEDAIMKTVKNLPGYESGDTVLGIYGQEILSVSITDINIPEEIKTASKAIEVEKLERESDMLDTGTYGDTAALAVTKLRDVGVDPTSAFNGLLARNGNMTIEEKQNTIRISAGAEVLTSLGELTKALVAVVPEIAKIKSPSGNKSQKGKPPIKGTP